MTARVRVLDVRRDVRVVQNRDVGAHMTIVYQDGILRFGI
jgi:hypothetical protein